MQFELKYMLILIVLCSCTTLKHLCSHGRFYKPLQVTSSHIMGVGLGRFDVKGENPLWNFCLRKQLLSPMKVVIIQRQQSLRYRFLIKDNQCRTIISANRKVPDGIYYKALR